MSKLLEVAAFMQEVDAAVLEHWKQNPFRPQYVIAGGALRDTLLGKPVKDIDIVVEDTRGWGVHWPQEEYGPTGGFQATDESPFSVRGIPVQLIYRGGDVSIPSMMQYHSLGVSNVFWKHGALVIDPLFLRDVADQQHTVNRSRWGGMGDDIPEERLQKYINKIRAKYPWPLR